MSDPVMFLLSYQDHVVLERKGRRDTRPLSCSPSAPLFTSLEGPNFHEFASVMWGIWNYVTGANGTTEETQQPKEEESKEISREDMRARRLKTLERRMQESGSETTTSTKLVIIKLFQ